MLSSSRASRIAFWLAGVLLVLALVLTGLRITVLDEARFADGLAGSLRQPAVRALVGRVTAAQLVDARPDLASVEPVIASGVAGLAGAPPVRAVLRGAARQLHRAIVEDDRDGAVLAAGNLTLFAVQALEAIDPKRAAEVPDSVEITLLSLQNGPIADALVGVASTARRVRILGWIGVGLALLALGVGVGLTRNRHLALRRTGLTLGIAGVVVATALGALIGLLPTALRGPDEAAAARGVLRSVLDPALGLALGTAAIGLVLALAARALTDATPEAVRAWRLARRVWEIPAGRASVAAGGLLLGGGLLLWPAPTGRAVAAILGVGLVITSLGQLLRLAGAEAPRRPASAEATSGATAAPSPGRARRRLRGPLGVAGVALAVVLLVAAATQRATDAPANATVVRCNGSASLCERRLDQVVFPATHNSMSASREGFLLANQRDGIAAQLDAGIRGLLVDTHLGIDTPRGVYTVLDPGGNSRAKLETTVGKEATATAERIRAQIGYRGGGDPAVYLCHGFCEIGATPAVTQLEAIRDFLVTHPGEVLVLSVEDDVAPAAFADAVRESGLAPLVWQGSVAPLPTLREMVDRDQRVLIVVEDDPGDVAWLHAQTRLFQETPYTLPTPAALLGKAGCRPGRGGTTPPMLLLNHFVAAVPPSASAAKVVNASAAVLEHARACETRRQRLPNLLAVDRADLGDVVGTARALNAEPVEKRRTAGP